MKENTFVCIASGPSLSDEQLHHVEINHDKCTVIAVNDNYQRYPDADFLFASDHTWWLHHYESAIAFTREDCTLHTIHGTRDKFHRKNGDDSRRELIEHRIHKQPRKIARDHMLFHGGNSGVMAIDLARLQGASKIIMIGYDHQHTNGLSHWFGDHPSHLRNQDIPKDWLVQFEKLSNVYEEKGIDLVNCSPTTALTYCRQSRIENEL